MKPEIGKTYLIDFETTCEEKDGYSGMAICLQLDVDVDEEDSSISLHYFQLLGNGPEVDQYAYFAESDIISEKV